MRALWLRWTVGEQTEAETDVSGTYSLILRKEQQTPVADTPRLFSQASWLGLDAGNISSN